MAASEQVLSGVYKSHALYCALSLPIPLVIARTDRWFSLCVQTDRSDRCRARWRRMSRPSPASLMHALPSINMLPCDVLRLIVGRASLRPRLLVLARVCRRWRTAAYQSVTSITRPYCYRGPLEVYPNLTECFLKDDASLPVAWTNQQRARLRSIEVDEATECAAADVASLPSLTNLKINFVEDWWPRRLTSEFQHLVSLDVETAGCRNRPDIGLLQHCASRLTRLATDRLRPYDGVTRLTALRELTLCGSFETGSLGCVLPALSSLISLAITTQIKDKPTAPRFVRSVAHMLVSIALPTSDISSELAEALYACPQLRQITRVSERCLPLLLPLAGRLNVLELELHQCVRRGDTALPSLLEPFSSLTVLHSPYTLLPNLRLPRLVELKVHCNAYVLPEIDLSCFPLLLRLHLSGFCDEDDGLLPLIHAADRCGLELLELDGTTSAKRLSSTLRWLTISVIPQ